MARKAHKRHVQQEMVYGRGGKRKNAGRKRQAERPQVPHVPRKTLDGRTPVHLTLRIRKGLGRLRRRDQHAQIRAAIARTGHKDDFRIAQYSIQGNHVHVIAEPQSRDALTRGATGFATSVAKRLNNLARRKGRVFADRYHARYLRTPREVRNALAYCLNNWRRHGEDRANPEWRTDPFSSADAFDGWTCGEVEPYSARHGPAPVAAATMWLLRIGWKRHGLLRPETVPGGR
jgi:putative transposase